MSENLVIFTTETEAPWISEAKDALAEVGDFRVIVKRKADSRVAARCSNVIIDITGVPNGLAFIEQCRRNYPHVRIFMAATEPEWTDTRDAYRAGATGVIWKNRGRKEIIDLLTVPKAGPSTVLMADNKEDFRKTWAEHLRDEGYEVICAGSPSEAEKKIASVEVDLAILDVRLQDDSDDLDTSGLAIASKISASIPVIILTNYPTAELVDRALRWSRKGRRMAVDFICKRESLDAFLEAVRRVLRPFPAMPSSFRDDEISQLYEKLAELRIQVEAEEDLDPAIDEELRGTFARLTELQSEEAREFRSAAEDRLLMPLDAGQDILARVDKLLKDDED